ncbi:MAG TPA: hypothetical protein VGR27_05635 [Longimicrobiaceae bacterium]|nr:hypothetical protein [Longimicrobiaceae bacterium]
MNPISRSLDLILGRPVALPAGLPEAMLPAGVVIRRGRLVPALGGWLSRLGGPAAAVALRRTIVVHPRVPITRTLLTHELAHVRQWEEDLLFPLRYTLETLRRGYVNNRYECEARAAETVPDPHSPS